MEVTINGKKFYAIPRKDLGNGKVIEGVNGWLFVWVRDRWVPITIPA